MFQREIINIYSMIFYWIKNEIMTSGDDGGENSWKAL